MQEETKKLIKLIILNNKNKMEYHEIQKALEDSGYNVSKSSIRSYCKSEIVEGEHMHILVKSKVNSRYLTDEEKATIDDNHDSKLIESQALDMGRSVSTIRRYYKSMGYITNSVLSKASKEYIAQNYKHKTIEGLSRRLKIKECKIYQHFYDNPDTLDLRLLDSEGFNEGEPYIERTEAELEGMTQYQKHVHQKINKSFFL